jgi:hypothetical protein
MHILLLILQLNAPFLSPRTRTCLALSRCMHACVPVCGWCLYAPLSLSGYVCVCECVRVQVARRDRLLADSLATTMAYAGEVDDHREQINVVC